MPTPYELPSATLPPLNGSLQGRGAIIDNPFVSGDFSNLPPVSAGAEGPATTAIDEMRQRRSDYLNRRRNEKFAYSIWQSIVRWASNPSNPVSQEEFNNVVSQFQQEYGALGIPNPIQLVQDNARAQDPELDFSATVEGLKETLGDEYNPLIESMRTQDGRFDVNMYNQWRKTEVDLQNKREKSKKESFDRDQTLLEEKAEVEGWDDQKTFAEKQQLRKNYGYPYLNPPQDVKTNRVSQMLGTAPKRYVLTGPATAQVAPLVPEGSPGWEADRQQGVEKPVYDAPEAAIRDIQSGTLPPGFSYWYQGQLYTVPIK